MDRLVQRIRMWKPEAVSLALVVLTAGGARAASEGPPGPALDDAQIVNRVVSFLRAEKQVADAVKGRLSSPGPWNLAQRVSVDDGDLDDGFGSMALRRQQGRDGAVANRQFDGTDFSGLAGDALNKAYVNREVKSHEAMLAELDQRLIPNASNELQRRLIGVRSEIVAHLLYARAVQDAEWRSEAAAQERADISREISNTVP